jgi:hypothetical protein
MAVSNHFDRRHLNRHSGGLTCCSTKIRNMKKIGWLLPLLLGACSSTRLTHSWKADSIPAAVYSRILVVALIQENDRNLQEKMEQHLVDDLRDLGYNAVSSLQEYGPKVFNQQYEQDIIRQLSGSGVDAIISIVLLNKERERRYVPGNVQFSPYVYYHSRFWRYYGTMQSRVYEPGYYVTDTRYFWESNFYAAKGERLIYSAQTRSFDPANTAGMAHEFGQRIVKDMTEKGILVRR